MEDEPGQRFFTLTDLEFENVGPVVDAGDVIYAWGESVVLVSIDTEHRVNLSASDGYVPAIIDPADPDANQLQAGTIASPS